jgi:SAM-dependent methyltransferase
MGDSAGKGSILSFVGRSAPEPWAEGDNIPWNEPGFSQRMLSEHLTQDHDMASRRSATIDAQVAWIHSEILGGRPSRVLDLGCGPGLYASRLARLGHRCLGIDYSPASIRYAREQAAATAAAGAQDFVLADLREADYGGPFDLAMQVFGEINVFKPLDARLILAKAARALAPGAALLLEVHEHATVAALGKGGSSWHASPGGLFSPKPYLCLEEAHWDPESAAATIRYGIVDAATGRVEHFAQSLQAYTEEGYARLLEDSGFAGIEFLPGFGAAPRTEGLVLVAARKRAGASGA